MFWQLKRRPVVDMTKEEQLTQILEKSRDKEIIHFLQGCTPEERKAIVPTLKKLTKYYTESVQVKPNTWSSRANDKQFFIMKCAHLVCYTRKEYETAGSVWGMDPVFFNSMLSWYCPPWFSDFVNGMGERDFIPAGLTYDYVIELEAKGYLRPEPMLIGRTLAPWIFEYREKSYVLLPEKLLRHPDTLESHIWHMFHTESGVHSANRWLWSNGKRMEEGWLEALRDHCAAGRINRPRLLEESLLASNRNFDKLMSGWCMELFEALQPSAEELMLLKEDLISVLSSPHSRVINGVLKLFKDIIDIDGFPSRAFMDQLPILLSSETKATVTTCLQLMEKMVKQDKLLGPELARFATAVFIHKDDSLQTRAAKFIEKWGDLRDEELRAALSLGMASILSGPRGMVAAFLDAPAAEEAFSDTPEMKQRLSDLEPLQPVANIDELVFLSSQLFDNNKPWHIDLFLEAMVRLQGQMRAEDLEKFAPSVQRALKLFFGDWRSTQGLLDYMMARIFLDFMLLQARCFPDGNAELVKLYASFLTKTEENKKIWEEHGLSTKFWSELDKDTSDPYYPWHFLMYGVLDDLLKGRDRIILSTPTHAPYWIDPAVLVKRLVACRDQRQVLDPMDFQIALSRCWLQEPAEAIALAEQLLEVEMKRLMLFVLDKDRRPSGSFEMDYAWMTAALVKDPNTVYPELSALNYSAKPRALLTGQYTWQSVQEDFEYQTHDWKNNKFVPVMATRKREVIKLDLPKKQEEKQESGLSKFLSIFKGAKETANVELSPLLPEYMKLERPYLNREDQDMQRLFGLMPSNPEPLMAAMLNCCLKEDPIEGESHKRAVIAQLQCVHEANPRLGEMGHLYLSACLLCSNKTAATYAAEIWIQSHRTLDNQLLGSMMGAHLRIAYAPLKRFTDLVVAKMMGVSPSGNAALSLVLRAMLTSIGDAPVKGVKKLVAIAEEVGKG
jgi:hypothetical protein